MPRLRIAIATSGDRAEELRVAARLRQAIWSQCPVEVDPVNPLHGTHRDGQGQPYFEFATHDTSKVKAVVREHDPKNRVTISEPTEPIGEACENCGNVAGPFLPPVCPTCQFRDISPCPICSREVPRQSYERISGDLFRCPNCRERVRLRFHSPLFNPKGNYNQPLVLVEAGVAHEVRS